MVRNENPIGEDFLNFLDNRNNPPGDPAMQTIELPWEENPNPPEGWQRGPDLPGTGEGARDRRQNGPGQGINPDNPVVPPIGSGPAPTPSPSQFANFTPSGGQGPSPESKGAISTPPTPHEPTPASPSTGRITAGPVGAQPFAPMPGPDSSDLVGLSSQMRKPDVNLFSALGSGSMLGSGGGLLGGGLDAPGKLDTGGQDSMLSILAKLLSEQNG